MSPAAAHPVAGGDTGGETGEAPAPAGDEVVVALDEALLADGLADARWLLHEALLGGARWIVVDLAGVDSLASPALASFLWAHRICRARGGGVVLRGADRRTADMLRRTGLWRVLRVQAGRAAPRHRARGTLGRPSALSPGAPVGATLLRRREP